tara:strand:- start:11991 stop:12176 length:186 start_codon:yes stop_codon:yes gene_type:complete
MIINNIDISWYMWASVPLKKMDQAAPEHFKKKETKKVNPSEDSSGAEDDHKHRRGQLSIKV